MYSTKRKEERSDLRAKRETDGIERNEEKGASGGEREANPRRGAHLFQFLEFCAGVRLLVLTQTPNQYYQVEKCADFSTSEKLESSEKESEMSASARHFTPIGSKCRSKRRAQSSERDSGTAQKGGI